MENESKVTDEMVKAFADKFQISLEDGSQVDGVKGTLNGLENGQGTVPEWMLTDELFAPVVEAHTKAKNEAV